MGMFERDVVGRLTRLETKLTRGFEELGVDISMDGGWLSVDESARVVNVETLARSLKVMMVEMERCGATQVGKKYHIFCCGEEVGSLIYRPQK